MLASEVSIREARFEDAVALRLLLKQLGYPQTLDSVKGRLHAYQEREDHFVFVAEIKGVIVGFISIAALESFVHPGRKYRVTALAIDQNSRRQGVGKALLHHGENVAKNKGGKFMELTSGLRRAADGSHHFYKALGYENEGYMGKLYLRKELLP